MPRPEPALPTTTSTAPLLEVDRVSKGFPGVQALTEVSFAIQPGEIHALIGENGAGKSTLIKILAGFLHPDSGTIRIDGQEFRPRTPRHSQNMGVSVVPQDVIRVPMLTVGRNVLLGHERFFVRRRSLDREDAERTRDALARVGADVGIRKRAGSLTVGEVRLCQIASTLAAPGRIVVLDEPTAVLAEHDAEALLERLIALRETGRAILYVSHRLPEVLRVADRITVLRNGQVVARGAAGEFTREALVTAMARTDETLATVRPPGVEGESREGHRLTVRGLTSDVVKDVSFDVDPGEIVGLAGVQGSGHGDVLRLIANQIPRLAGEVTVHGQRIGSASTVIAYEAGIALVPADRSRAAILPALSIKDNIVLGANSPCQRAGFRLRRSEGESASELVSRLAIRPARLGAIAGHLSGGNQQKVALARLLHTQARVILLEEPTQGVDVNAKNEIYALVETLARQGRTILWASSEFEELRDHAHRIIVLCSGRVAGQFGRNEATYRDVLNLALP